MQRSLLGVVGLLAIGLFVAGSTNVAFAEERTAPRSVDDGKETPPDQDPLPADLTGDADQSAERDRLRSLLAPLVEYDGGLLWDGDSGVLTVRMTSDAALEQARKIVSASATPLATEFERVEYSQRELDELAARLLEHQKEWAGATGIGGGHDPASNRVLLQVDPNFKDAPILIRAIENLDDPRVVLERIEPVEGWAPESRVDDYQPYTAGAAIDSANYGCTLGFTWKRWGSGQIVGSTARHCIDVSWYNNGTYVGTVFQSKPGVDSAIMSGTSYSPTVFVGNQTTNVVRRVVAIDTAWGAGDSVAMSGRTTGLTVATVKMPTYTLPSCAGTTYSGMSGVLMNQHYTDHGDSGGPGSQPNR